MWHRDDPFWRKAGLIIAGVLAVLGLLALSALLFFYYAISQWGNSK